MKRPKGNLAVKSSTLHKMHCQKVLSSSTTSKSYSLREVPLHFLWTQLEHNKQHIAFLFLLTLFDRFHKGVYTWALSSAEVLWLLLVGRAIALSERGKLRERKGRNLCRITCVNLPFNAQIGQLLVRLISSLFTWVDTRGGGGTHDIFG